MITRNQDPTERSANVRLYEWSRRKDLLEAILRWFGQTKKPVDDESLTEALHRIEEEKDGPDGELGDEATAAIHQLTPGQWKQLRKEVEKTIDAPPLQILTTPETRAKMTPKPVGQVTSEQVADLVAAFLRPICPEGFTIEKRQTADGRWFATVTADVTIGGIQVAAGRSPE